MRNAVRRWPKGLSCVPACQMETFSAFHVSTGPTVIAIVGTLVNHEIVDYRFILVGLVAIFMAIGATEFFTKVSERGYHPVLAVGIGAAALGPIAAYNFGGLGNLGGPTVWLNNAPGASTAGHQAALGCRYRCTFCGVAAMFRGRTALPPAGRLDQDLRLLQRVLRDLVGETLIIYPRAPRPSYADQVLALFHDRALEPAKIYEARELQIALGLVAAGEGVDHLGDRLGPEGVADLRAPDRHLGDPGPGVLVADVAVGGGGDPGGAHAGLLVVAGTAGRPRVDLDAFVTIR